MRLRTIITLATIILLAGEPAWLFAQGANRAHHAWGRCKVGAWKEVRQLIETLDEKGSILNSSSMETKTTLEDVSDNDYTLRIELTVEVAGKRITKAPQVIRQGYNGESEGQKVTSKVLGKSDVTINGHTFASEVREVVVNGGDTKRTSMVHFSDKVAPFILKRETRSTDAEGKATNSQTQVEVLAVDMPFNVLSEVKNASLVKVLQKQPKTTSLTLEFHCDAVPGGVFAHTMREDDESGRTIRRGTLELIDYGTGIGDAEDDNKLGRRRLFHRNRGRNGAVPANGTRLE